MLSVRVGPRNDQRTRTRRGGGGARRERTGWEGGGVNVGRNACVGGKGNRESGEADDGGQASDRACLNGRGRRDAVYTGNCESDASVGVLVSAALPVRELTYRTVSSIEATELASPHGNASTAAVPGSALGLGPCGMAKPQVTPTSVATTANTATESIIGSASIAATFSRNETLSDKAEEHQGGKSASEHASLKPKPTAQPRRLTPLLAPRGATFASRVLSTDSREESGPSSPVLESPPSALAASPMAVSAKGEAIRGFVDTGVAGQYAGIVSGKSRSGDGGNGEHALAVSSTAAADHGMPRGAYIGGAPAATRRPSSAVSGRVSRSSGINSVSATVVSGNVPGKSGNASTSVRLFPQQVSDATKRSDAIGSVTGR
eukprot:TRINITY_DN21221_c0_g1_i2.p1 TRINITY_DN21221_c0_g1~~TRINITY_DN21221_c0_g1_i2.p1  ORF type:complete len:376 (-),score=53.29 TRINITY_DN21221_c0_g1_i2:141-1268(-)